MKITKHWLHRHLKTDASTNEIVSTMIKIGLEVDEVSHEDNLLELVSVAKIISTSKHPNADKLQICQVETIDGMKQIICGAPNARASIKVAFAPIGTYLKKIDLLLKKIKIRGIESEGMLCSLSELDIGDDHDGIIEIPQSEEIGKPLSSLHKQKDTLINFEVTPNRPDTNGVLSVAKDLVAAKVGEFIPTQIDPVKIQHNETIKITSKDNNIPCPLFATRIIKNVTNASSPPWLKSLLKTIGINSNSALVDITNFMAFDRARPMHVYDKSKVSNNIILRYAYDNEEFKAINEKTYTLNHEDFVIADDKKILALAGIIGGASSKYEDKTTDIILECAYFEPSQIMRTGTKYNIITDARYRFERGIDRNDTPLSMDFATNLILNICGGEAGEILYFGKPTTELREIVLDHNHVKRLIGIEISTNEQIRILTDLGFHCSDNDNTSLLVKVPSSRPDCSAQTDLVEEIIRIYGFDKIQPQRFIPANAKEDKHDKNKYSQYKQSLLTRCVLSDLNYQEVISWAFCSHKIAKEFTDNLNDDLFLQNPISETLNYMRPNAFASMLSIMQYNLSRKRKGIKIFEIGGSYNHTGPEGQKNDLFCMMHISKNEHWQNKEPSSNLYFACYEIFTILEKLLQNTDLISLTNHSGQKFYHPNMSADIIRTSGNNITPIGHLGFIHPALAKKINLDENIIMWQLNLSCLFPAIKEDIKFPPFYKYSSPSVERDFAFVLPKKIPAIKLIKTIEKIEDLYINNVNIFDNFCGGNIDPCDKSIALRVKFQHTDKTFTSEEIDKFCQIIIEKVQTHCQAKLRL